MRFIRNAADPRRLRLPQAAVALATLALGACVVQPVGPDYGYGGAAYYTPGPYAYVSTPPPEPRVEVMGVAPGPGYLWLTGYWGWAGGRHEWVPGRWEAPRPGYYYEPHRWVHEDRGWRLHEGGWREDRGRAEHGRD